MATTHMLSSMMSHKDTARSISPGFPGREDDEPDYVEMTPSHKARSALPDRLTPKRTQSARSLLGNTTPTNFDNRKNFDEDDYADMKGGSEVEWNQSISSTPRRHKSPSMHSNNNMPLLINDKSQHPRVDQSSSNKNKQSFASSKSVDSIMGRNSSRVHSSSIHSSSSFDLQHYDKEPRIPKRRIQVGGFNKDDEDDYTDVELLQCKPSNGIAQSKSPREHQQPQLPSTAKLAEMGRTSEYRKKEAGHYENQRHRNRSGGMSLPHSNLSIYDSDSITISKDSRAKSIKTAAGVAARKYLESQVSIEKDPTKLFELKRTSSAGIMRSPSRASGGVQSRINRSRQYMSLKHQKSPDVAEDASDQRFGTDKEVSSPVCKSNNFHMNKNVQEKERTNNEKVLATGKNETLFSDSFTEDIPRAESFHKAFQHGSDGSRMLKFIGDNKKSHSLDKNYIEWLAKTTPYVSRTPSSASSLNESDGARHHSTSELSVSAPFKKTSDLKGDANEDDAFETYVQSVSRHQDDLSRDRSKTTPAPNKAEKEKKKQKSIFKFKYKKEKSKDSVKKEAESTAKDGSAFAFSKSSKFRKSSKSKNKKKNESDKVLKEALTNKSEAQESDLVLEIDLTETEPSKEQLKTHDANHNRNNEEKISQKKSVNGYVSVDGPNSSISSEHSRNENANSGNFYKKDSISKKPAPLSRVASVPQITIDSHTQLYSDLKPSRQQSENSLLSSTHKRNKSDVLPSLKNFSVLSLQASTLDISLSSNYDDEQDSNFLLSPLKAKHNSGKANTLGRIFGKKSKDRKPIDLGKFRNNSDEHLLSDYKTDKRAHSLLRSSNHAVCPDCDLPPSASTYMQHSFLVHGFAFDKPRTDKHYDRDKKMRMSTFSQINKYATITGINSFRRPTTPKSTNAFDNETHHHSESERRTLSSQHSPVATRSICWNSDDEDYDDVELFHSSLDPSLCSLKEKVLPICMEKNERMMEMAAILLHCIRSTQPDILLNFNDLDELSDDDSVATSTHNSEPEQFLPGTFAKGNELVVWLDELITAKQKYDEKYNHFKAPPAPTRRQICGMWQVLLEEGAICHVNSERHFEDSDEYFAFHNEVISEKLVLLTEDIDHQNGEIQVESMSSLMPYWVEELDLSDVLSYLACNSHDALFRKILRKQPGLRSTGELKMIYEELLHFNSISNLSDSVKRELARVVSFEAHYEEGKVLFRQGDEGSCWYIILRGSVEVEVNGKGVVCTLQEGDDFGSLALMNSAPRSATIILAEPECHFIRVDKSDYFRILKDVEENTMRLKEHGKDVLILEKVTTGNGDHHNHHHHHHHDKINGTAADYIATSKRRAHSYSITAGTPERILEHILEYLQPWKITFYDETLENFILMFATFMKSENLFCVLLDRYRSEDIRSTTVERSMKRKIVYFIVRWSYIVTYLRQDDEGAENFLKELGEEIKYDCIEHPEYSLLKDEFAHVYHVEDLSESQEDIQSAIFVIEENVKKYQTGSDVVELHRPLRPHDQTLTKVYNSEQTYTTVKLPLCATSEEVVAAASEKLSKSNNKDLQLIEVLETGDRIVLSKSQRSIATIININSTLCINEDRDSFELKKPTRSLPRTQKFHFDDVSSLEIAYYVTQYDWHLLDNIHVLEYIYKVFGARKFQRITPNLDILARRFNQLAYWPPSEICTCTNLNKRALILRKFIKIAQHLKRYQNMNAFMAVMIGIGNQSVSRLTNTWEKLPAKYRKLVKQFETILDPSRNHHNYRVFASSMEPPYLPYFPLLMKDMTFQHEGNDNQKQELVNFEKMHMISTSIRTIIRGCTMKIEEDGIFTTTKTSEETKKYVQCMKVITNQRTLNELSSQLEPKR